MLGLAKVIVGACAAIAAAAAALAGWGPAQPTVSMPHATCGTVITHLLSADSQLVSASRGALTCFDAAARNCRAASIQVTQLGVDTGTQYVFAVEPGRSPCRLIEYSQSWSAGVGGRKGPVRTTDCRQLALTRSGVALRCAGQDYLIPAAALPGNPAAAP